MDKLLAMTVFRTVVESGSFARASEKLGLSTTTTSRQIGELEKSLGVPLLHRSTRKISLTDGGRLYFDRCCSHLDDIAATEHEVCGQNVRPVGTLRLSVPSSFGKIFLAPRLEGFLKAYPELRVDIQFSDRLVDLAEEGVDVAIRIAQQAPSTLVGRPLATIRRVLCASPVYLASCAAPRHPADLKNHNCLIYSNLADGVQWWFHKNGKRYCVPVQGTLRANCGEMLRAAAVAGCGIILEPSFIVGKDLGDGRLIRLLPDYDSDSRTVFAVFQSAGRNSAKIRVLVDYLARILEEDAAVGNL
jgi:DNA-binding transcriptional LysR family regulator